MRTVSQTKGHPPPPPPDGWDSQQYGHSPFFKKFLVSETTENSSPAQVVSRTRNTNQQRAHGSPSHQGRLRLQVENVHNQLQTILEISMTDVLTWTLTLNSGCSSLHITCRRLLLHRESLLLMLSHLALIQQRCVDSCPGSLRHLLHDSSRQIDAYSSLNRFSSRSTNATISESPIATVNEH